MINPKSTGWKQKNDKAGISSENYAEIEVYGKFRKDLYRVGNEKRDSKLIN